MTLRNRIALTFMLANFAVLVLVLVLLYILTRQYTHKEFFNRLEDRAHIAAQALLEKDELAHQLIEEINRRHSRTLPQEKEYFFLLDSLQKIVANTPEYISMGLLKTIDRDGIVEFRSGKLSGVGIRYEDNQGVYAAIVVAQDLYGQRESVSTLGEPRYGCFGRGEPHRPAQTPELAAVDVALPRPFSGRRFLPWPLVRLAYPATDWQNDPEGEKDQF